MELKKKYIKFLDKLDKSGLVIMYGAHLYLIRNFPELDTKKKAKDILIKWMSMKKNKFK